MEEDSSSSQLLVDDANTRYTHQDKHRLTAQSLQDTLWRIAPSQDDDDSEFGRNRSTVQIITVSCAGRKNPPMLAFHSGETPES